MGGSRYAEYVRADGRTGVREYGDGGVNSFSHGRAISFGTLSQKKGSFSMVMHLSTSPSVVARLRALLFSGFRWKTAAGGEICSDGCKQFCSMCKPANLSLSAAETMTIIALYSYSIS